MLLLLLLLVCMVTTSVDHPALSVVDTTSHIAIELVQLAGRAGTIRLRGGVYHTSLNLTSAHSGITIEAASSDDGGAAAAAAVVLKGMHHITGAVGVTLRGLKLVGDDASSATLTVAGSESVEVDRCIVDGGVEVHGGVGHRIHHSRISNAGGGHCVWIAACGNMSTAPWLPCNVSVDNNVITDCFNKTGGPYAPGSAGVLLGCTNGVDVNKNHILRTDSWGVRVNNNDYCPSVLNNVSLNRIEQYGEGPGMHEGTCMYAYGHWFSPGNTFEYNHCHSGPICMYADDASSGQTFRGNICQNITGDVMKINGGHANRIEGNMLLQSTRPNGLTGRGMGWKCPLDLTQYKSVYACKNVFHDNGEYPNGKWGEILRNANFESPPWSTHWPWSRGWCNYTSFNGQECDPDGKGYDCFMMPTMNTITSTAIVMQGHDGQFPVLWAPCVDAAVQCCPAFVCSKDFNTNGTSARYLADPGFVDFSTGDLTLKADSVIFRDLPGFPHVPFSDIGPDEDVIASH